MAAQRRGPGSRGRAPDGQHFLRSARLAAELVDRSGVGPDDLVVEIGGGTGRLTAPLVARARRVLVVERDPGLVTVLRGRFADVANVEVVEANALHARLPDEPFRVFGNLPFAFGTGILRRLLDEPASDVQRLDALLQFEVARKRAQLVPGTLTSIGWQPWWEFRLVRRVHRAAFEPAPSVDAGLLSVMRREPPLLPASARKPFIGSISRGFAAPATPMSVTYRRKVTPGAWRRFADERGLPRDARPADLDASDWAALFRTFLRPSFGRDEAVRPHRP